MSSKKRLTICVATFNRGRFIEETLRNILNQIGQDTELLVLDGNSPDSTPEVMNRLLNEFSHMRYIRENKNGGIDADYDKAVGLAEGEYVWLMTDDDLLVEGAVDKVLNEIAKLPDLLILNSAVFDRTFENLLLPKFIDIGLDQEFDGSNLDATFKLAGACLSFIGGVVIKKEIWHSRNRQKYYGSLFVHVGVIFQNNFIGKIKILSEPLIKIRYGNAMWTARGFEIWMIKWPELVHSFSLISESTKNFVCSRGAGRTLKYLVYYRGMGIYSFLEYKKLMAPRLNRMTNLVAFFIAICPRFPIIVLLSLYFGFWNTKNKLGMYDLIIGKGLNFFSAWIAESKVFGNKVWLKRP